MERFDSIIIGAGHNGLVCAAYLAKGGQRVLVLEAGDRPGGLAADREFSAGFHVSIAHTVGHLPQTIVNDLELPAHGFQVAARLATVGVGTGGNHVRVQDGVTAGVADRDAVAFAEYSRLLERIAGALEPFWLKTMPRIGSGSLGDILTYAHVGLNLRRLGKADMREFLRIASLPVRDLLDEFFEGELLKATLAWDGLIGSKMAPRSPNGAVLAMLYRLSGASRGGHGVPVGGTDGLATALAASAAAAGADIRYGATVEKISIGGGADGLATRGVRLADGTEIESDRVVSGADPQRTFLDLVGVEYLDIGFSNRIRRLRCDGYVAKLHLALDGPPEFPGLERADGRLIIAPDMDTIETAFDTAKYGECPEHPVLEIVLPSFHDLSLAPEGAHVLSAHVMYVPYRLKDGWTDGARERICERAIETIARYAPGIRERIVAAEFLAPADLEREARLTGGHWHHTELAMDQMLMMRPTCEAAQYGTPIPGLYLCGAGCHPGGDLTGAAGHNAAKEILK